MDYQGGNVIFPKKVDFFDGLGIINSSIAASFRIPVRMAFPSCGAWCKAAGVNETVKQ
jgi:hypothetical protein